MIDAICFDLDGTIIDPYEGISRSIAFALERLGRTTPGDSEYSAYIGPPLSESFALLLKGEEHLVPIAVQYYRERFSTVGIYENTLYPEIESVLRTLSSKVRLYLCTSKPLEYATRILEEHGLTSNFANLYGSEFDGTRSNKVELLHWLLYAEHLTGKNVVMIGDRRHDIEAAIANDVQPYGALWGYGSAMELHNAGATLCFTSPKEILALDRAPRTQPRE